MRTRLLVTVLLAAGLLVCAAHATTSDTKKMVLKLQDLPAGFSLDKGYYADNARAAKETKTTTLAEFTRWGRITGYEADFSREALTGILFITSSASLTRPSRVRRPHCTTPTPWRARRNV